MNFVIQDNFFDDPDSIRKHALSLKYYTKENHPYGIGVFPGYRTDYFDKINSKFYNAIHNKILPHISKLENVNHPKEKYTDFNLQISFSYTLKEVPVVGKLTYQWLGGGLEKDLKREAKERKQERIFK